MSHRVIDRLLPDLDGCVPPALAASLHGAHATISFLQHWVIAELAAGAEIRLSTKSAKDVSN